MRLLLIIIAMWITAPTKAAMCSEFDKDNAIKYKRLSNELRTLEEDNPDDVKAIADTKHRMQEVIERVEAQLGTECFNKLLKK